jgi:[ribosomal protein S18]-alanine N-acetyltransferase
VADPSARVRPATREDVARVWQIERASFADPWSERSFHELLDQPHVYFRVLADGDTDEALGYVVAWFVVSEAEIANVAVAPDARGRKLGGRLLDDVLSAARSRGVTEAFLEVRDSNVAARALYESRGFAAVGRRRGYYVRPREDAIVMRAGLEHADETK